MVCVCVCAHHRTCCRCCAYTTDSLLGISVSVLVFSLPKVADPVAQRVGIYVWIFIYASLHALLVSLFKSKNPSYPFSFILW